MVLIQLVNMNLQWGTVFYLSNGAQDIFFSGNVLFQPNRFFFTILCRRWIFNMYMNMFSMKEISASWKLFLSNSMLCVSFSDVSFCLSQDFSFQNHVCPIRFWFLFQDHFPQTSLSGSSVSRYTVRLQELFSRASVSRASWSASASS